MTAHLSGVQPRPRYGISHAGEPDSRKNTGTPPGTPDQTSMNILSTTVGRQLQKSDDFQCAGRGDSCKELCQLQFYSLSDRYARHPDRSFHRHDSVTDSAS